jgi:hypothetical protein
MALKDWFGVEVYVLAGLRKRLAGRSMCVLDDELQDPPGESVKI